MVKKISVFLLYVGLFFTAISLGAIVPPPPPMMPMPAAPMPTAGLPGLQPARPPAPAMSPLPAPAPLPGAGFARPAPLTPMLPPAPLGSFSPAAPIAPRPGFPPAAPLPPQAPGMMGPMFGDEGDFGDFFPEDQFMGPLPGGGMMGQQPGMMGMQQQMPGQFPGQFPMGSSQIPGQMPVPPMGQTPFPGAQPVAQDEPVKAIDTVALQAFPEGSKVVLLFVGQGEKEARLLKVTRGIFISPIGKDPFDPKCHFVVLRKGNWIGFKSDYLKGNTLQSDPKNLVVHCPSQDFSADNHKVAHWSAQFINPKEASSVMSLQNRATQGFLNFPYEPWAENLAWTALKERVPATAAGERGFLKMVKIAELPKKTIAGGLGDKDFLYTPRLHRESTPMYSDGWKFDVPGSGVVTFDAYTKKKIVIGISTVAENLANNMYYLVIGDENGKSITIRKQADGPIFYKQLLRKSPEELSMQEGKDRRFVSYWIQVESGKVSCGFGRIVGQGTVLEWTDPDKPLKVQFVGFSGGRARVSFKNISVGGKKELSSTVVLPEDFKQEAGTLKRVTVGYQDSQLEIWGIAVDNTLWRWKADSMAANPWELQKVVLSGGAEVSMIDDVSISSGGDLFVVSQGKVYRFDWPTKYWGEIDTGVQRVQVVAVSGHVNNLWAVGTDGVAYQYLDRGWKKRSDPESAKRVVVSPDNEVFVLNKAKTIFRYKGDNRWERISDSTLPINDFFVINKELIFAIDDKNGLWQYTAEKKWSRVAGENRRRVSGFVQGAGNVGGMIVLLDQQGNIYKRSDKNANKDISQEKIRQMMEQAAPAYAPAKKVQKKTEKAQKKVQKKAKKKKKKAAKKKKSVKKKAKKKQKKKQAVRKKQKQKKKKKKTQQEDDQE